MEITKELSIIINKVSRKVVLVDILTKELGMSVAEISYLLDVPEIAVRDCLEIAEKIEKES